MGRGLSLQRVPPGTDNRSMTETSGPGSPTVLPDALSAMVGGGRGPSYHVLWEDGALRYRGGDGWGQLDSVPWEVVVPTDSAWRTFWDRVDGIGIWNWHEHYENPGIVDGTSWSITLERGARSVSSSGDNSYPTGEPGEDEPFHGLLDAVADLTGKMFR